MRSAGRHLAADLTQLPVDAVTACQEVRQVTNIVTTVEAPAQMCGEGEDLLGSHLQPQESRHLLQAARINSDCFSREIVHALYFNLGFPDLSMFTVTHDDAVDDTKFRCTLSQRDGTVGRCLPAASKRVKKRVPFDARGGSIHL